LANVDARMIFTSSPLRMGIARTWRGGEKTAVVEKVWTARKERKGKKKRRRTTPVCVPACSRASRTALGREFGAADRRAARPNSLSLTLCFSNNSFDKCALISRRMDDESADSIALRCFLRDSVTVDLNFILAGATKKNRRS
jgi:hypothetical protein